MREERLIPRLQRKTKRIGLLLFLAGPVLAIWNASFPGTQEGFVRDPDVVSRTLEVISWSFEPEGDRIHFSGRLKNVSPRTIRYAFVGVTSLDASGHPVKVAITQTHSLKPGQTVPFSGQAPAYGREQSLRVSPLCLRYF